MVPSAMHRRDHDWLHIHHPGAMSAAVIATSASVVSCSTTQAAGAAQVPTEAARKIVAAHGEGVGGLGLFGRWLLVCELAVLALVARCRDQIR